MLHIKRLRTFVASAFATALRAGEDTPRPIPPRGIERNGVRCPSRARQRIQLGNADVRVL